MKIDPTRAEALQAIPGHDISAGIDIWGRKNDRQDIHRWVQDHPEVQAARNQITTILRACYRDPVAAHDAALALVPPAPAGTPLSIIERAAGTVGEQVRVEPELLGPLKGERSTEPLVLHLRGLPSAISFLMFNLMRNHSARAHAIDQQLRRDATDVTALDEGTIGFITMILNNEDHRVALWYEATNAPAVERTTTFLDRLTYRIGLVEPKTYVDAAQAWASAHAPANSGFQAGHIPRLRQALRLRERLQPVVTLLNASV